MTARMLPGGPVAEAVLAELKPRIAALVAAGHTPGLGTILVGDDPASAGYIRVKQEKAAELGLNSPHLHLPETTTQAELIGAIRAFNDDVSVDAMLVQHPTPPQIDFDGALIEMDPDKDVDGLHPTNMGRLALGMRGPVPCTPAGIEALLAYYEIPVSGRSVCILGRGTTLGRPLSLLLTQKRPTANAAVTVVHTGVVDMAALTRTADVIVSAAGVPGIVTADMVRSGAAVVGAGTSFSGKKLLSDLADDVAEKAAWITPRLGGVGPMTRAMLLRNAVLAAEKVR